MDENKIVPERVKLKSLFTISIYIALMLAIGIIFSKYVDKDSLQAVIKSSGQLGILVYFLIEVVYVTFTPLFNSAILIASGYIFGGHAGFIINFLATTIGLLWIVFLVRKYGRPLLQRVVSPKFYNRFDLLTKKIGPITLLILYVLPFTPDDELTYIIAAGSISIKRFILPILLGSIAKAAFSYIGDMGAKGITIAGYARVAMLIVGLIVVGIQEYIVRKRELAKVFNVI